jgi:hypothetical protein
VSWLCTYECIQRRILIEGNEDHVPDAALAVLERDEVARLNRSGDVRDSEIITVHIVEANRNSDHAGIVPPGSESYLVAKTAVSWRARVRKHVLH